MTHVVVSACVDKKYQECVAVCPVECFHEADTYLVIDPSLTRTSQTKRKSGSSATRSRRPICRSPWATLQSSPTI